MGRRDGSPVGGIRVVNATVRQIAEINPDAFLAEGFDAALVGYTENTHLPTVAVYDIDRCVQVLVRRDGMTAEGAEDFLAANTTCAYVGENGPVFVRFCK